MASSESTFIVREIFETCQLRMSQMSIIAALISYYLDHDAPNTPKHGTLGPLLTNCKKSIVFFWTKTWFLQLEMLVRGISWSVVVYSSITLHIVVHGKTATKLKVKSGSLHQLEWFHSKEAKDPATSERLNPTVIPMKSMGLCLNPLICLPKDPASCNCIQI